MTDVDSMFTARTPSIDGSDTIRFYELEPTAAHTVLDDLRATPTGRLTLAEEWMCAPAPLHDGWVRLVAPTEGTGPLPVLVHLDGGGWVHLNGGWVLGHRLTAAAQCWSGGAIGPRGRSR